VSEIKVGGVKVAEDGTITIDGTNVTIIKLFTELQEKRIREIIREETCGHNIKIRQLEAQLSQLAAEVTFLIANDKKTQPPISD
jgi:hypothetical protein